MSRILVTGGAGFIGGHFTDLMIERGCEVFVVDKMTYAARAKNVNPKVSSFQPWDIGNEIVADLLTYHRITEVINFAAETHVDRSIKDPEAFLRTDILGLFNLVRSCRKAGVERFVHVSTDEVYGPMPEDEPYGASEKRALNPTSPYSASKASADLLLLSFFKTYGFPVVIVRPCNQYGPRQYPEKLIPMVITRILQGQKVLVHGKGEEIREWMYVGDCCQLIDTVRRRGSVGEIYNLGSGERWNNKRVIKGIFPEVLFPRGYCISHEEEDMLFEELTEEIPNRPGNDARYALNSEKLRLFHLNYPSTDFQIGLQETVEWYKSNPDWWEDEVDWKSNIYTDNKDYLR